MHAVQMVLCIEAVETTVALLRGAPMTPPTLEHVMSPVQFDLVSHWRIPAPVDAVWAALTHPEAWPDWWPYVRQVVTLRKGDAEGLGSVRRIDWVLAPA
jgi:hypothetical protein